jgi:hypothetical protein
MDKNTSPSIVSLYDALKYFRKKELNFGDYLSTGYRQLNELIIGLNKRKFDLLKEIMNSKCPTTCKENGSFLYMKSITCKGFYI